VLADATAKSTDSEPDTDGDAEPGFVDILAEGEEAMERLTEILRRYGELMAEVNAITQTSTDEVTASDSRGGGFGARLTVAKRLAENLKPPVSEMDALSDEYLRQTYTVDAAVDYLIGSVESGQEQLEDMRAYFGAIVEAAYTVEECAPVHASYVHSVRGLAKISRSLIPASKTLARSTNRVVSGSDTIIRWRERIKALPGWFHRGDGEGADPLDLSSNETRRLWRGAVSGRP